LKIEVTNQVRSPKAGQIPTIWQNPRSRKIFHFSAPLYGATSRKNSVPEPVGKVTANPPLVLATEFVTGHHTVGGVKFVVVYNIQSLAHPGQLIVNALARQPKSPAKTVHALHNQ